MVNAHRVFMDSAISLSRLSKCVSIGVGCVAVNERGRIVGSGVNGSISGYKNCCELHTDRGPTHRAWSVKYEIHAEMNCILEMARSPVYNRSLTFYVTHSPCWNCLKHMLGMKAKGEMEVVAIVYNTVYHGSTDEDIKEQMLYCNEFGVKFISINEIENQ